MTDQERALVVECLNYRLIYLSPAQHPEKRAMLHQLIERLENASVSDATPVAAKKKPIIVKTTSDGVTTVADAIEQAARIVEMCEQVSGYDSSDAWDFASSVQEKAESIACTIEERNHVTPAQAEALDNMESGISRWIR